MNVKKIIVLFLLLILAFSLVSCGGGSNNKDSDKFEFGQDYINNNLKGDYWIIYNTTYWENGKSNTSSLEMIKTDKGYYYGEAGENGVLYIKNGDKYDVYYQGGDAYESSGFQFDPEMVESMMLGITGYMNNYASYSSGMKKAGSETVAGRNCEKYTFGMTFPIKYQAVYCIDKETGVCMKLTMEVDAGGQKAGYEFECTKFQTSNVSLPKYN